jgi:hypothetical protein
MIPADIHLNPKQLLIARILSALQSAGLYMRAQSDNPHADKFFVCDSYQPGLTCRDVKQYLGEELAPYVELELLTHMDMVNRVAISLRG